MGMYLTRKSQRRSWARDLKTYKLRTACAVVLQCSNNDHVFPQRSGEGAQTRDPDRAPLPPDGTRIQPHARRHDLQPVALPGGRVGNHVRIPVLRVDADDA